MKLEPGLVLREKPHRYLLHPPPPLQLPPALPVPVPLPSLRCEDVLWDHVWLRCPVSPLGDILTLTGRGVLSWWCRTTASPQLSVVHPSSPSIRFPRSLWQALLITQTSSQGLLAEAFPYISCFVDHLGKTGRDFPPCSGPDSFTHPSGLSSLPVPREQRLRRAALGRAALAPGAIFCYTEYIQALKRNN